jgi:aspartate racemase
MRTIGLIGGVTWESTADYYRIINSEVSRRLGGAHSAKIALISLDFHEVTSLTRAGDEEAVYALYRNAATQLKACDAGLLVLCANTAHRRAERLNLDVGLPIVHIGDATGSAIRRAGYTTVGLVGTLRTMEEAFLRGRLEGQFGVSVLVPDEGTRKTIDHLIFEEMATGIFSDHARRVIAEASADMKSRGAQGVILGCTELPILMRGQDLGCPTFNTTELHASAAVDRALLDQ